MDKQAQQPRTGAHLLSQPVLFQTVHGSRLYGLARPDSDHDTYTVVAEPRDPSPSLRARQTLQEVVTEEDGTVTDSTTVGLSWFLHLCAEGVPQALEAMFAPAPVMDTFVAYRAAYRANPHTTRATYRRAITDHAARGTGLLAVRRTVAPVKARRHAVRMALNLATALDTGRFDPVLTPAQVRTVITVADAGTFVADLRALTDGMVDLDRHPAA